MPTHGMRAFRLAIAWRARPESGFRAKGAPVPVGVLANAAEQAQWPCVKTAAV